MAGGVHVRGVRGRSVFRGGNEAVNRAFQVETQLIWALLLQEPFCLKLP